MPSTTTPVSGRLTSLDQFRGYTMFGMLLVNFLGGYAVCPRILKHSHDYCSYADTIMPQFLFAAGFALRLSLGKRLAVEGRMPWGRAMRRIAGLALVAIAWYTFCDLKGIVHQFGTEQTLNLLSRLAKRNWFQTLSHIAATSLWILPVMGASTRSRVWYAIGSGAAHVVLSWWFNFVWVNSDPKGVDGGPLGFLTWAIPALCGTLACDAVRASGVAAARRIAMYGLAMMILGYALSCGTTLYDIPAQSMTVVSNRSLATDPVLPAAERFQNWNGRLAEPPFVPPPTRQYREGNYWMMSQRSGALSYLTFAAGLSLLIYSLCLCLCDGWGWQLGIFRTLGVNSLAAYILNDVASWIVAPYFPESSSSLVSILTGFASSFLIVYGMCRVLEWRGWYLRV